MKKILTFLLLVAFCAQCFNNAFIVLSFYANQKYIASKLCENKYKPMLHCDGKCVLAKKLKQEENKDNQNPERKMENKNEVISSRSFFADAIFPFNKERKTYFDYVDDEINHYSPAIFHPPSA
ncbi:MAG: hypothetical protein ABUT20_09580 [Bacteroidota bacterium]